MSRPRLVALLLALVTLLVYAPVSQYAFLNYDDDEYVTNNRMVEKGLTIAGVKWAFTAFAAGNWHPLTWVSHMLDCEIFNLDPGAHHLISALFHAVNSALLFVLLWRLTGKPRAAAFVAALFAWHPLHVESVAWISERKDVLSTFFALLSLLNYGKYVQEKHWPGYGLALLFFVLGLLAKPMLVTLPCVLLLLDYWPLKRFSLNAFPWRLLFEKTPFFLFAAVSCVLTFRAQNEGHAVVSLHHYPLPDRLANAAVAAMRYLGKLVWPTDLAVIYPLAKISTAAWILAVTGLIVISILVWRERERRPYCLVGWLWFLGTLVPVIGLVQVGATALADRYTYIPSIGIFIAAVFIWQEHVAFKNNFFLAAIPLLIACVVLTEKQIGYWRNSETLFRHALAVTQNSEFAHSNLGLALEQQNRTAEALVEFREAALLNQNIPQFHFFIGNALETLNRPAQALTEYRECLKVNPDVAALHNAVGCALAAQGKGEAALAEFAEASRLDPHYARPHLEAAKFLFSQGQDAMAVERLRAAALAEPYNYQILASVAHFLAANEIAAARDGSNAIIFALQANDLAERPQSVVFDSLAMAFAEIGDFSNAVACAQSALELAAATDPKQTDSLRERLQRYQNHQPWRESFHSKNPPVKN